MASNLPLNTNIIDCSPTNDDPHLVQAHVSLSEVHGEDGTVMEAQGVAESIFSLIILNANISNVHGRHDLSALLLEPRLDKICEGLYGATRKDVSIHDTCSAHSWADRVEEGEFIPQAALDLEVEFGGFSENPSFLMESFYGDSSFLPNPLSQREVVPSSSKWGLSIGGNQGGGVGAIQDLLPTTKSTFSDVKSASKRLPYRVDIEAENMANLMGESWSQVVNNNVQHKGFTLEYVAPCMKEDKVVVQPPHEVLNEGNKMWATTLEGYFLDQKLNYQWVNNVAFRLWGKESLEEVLTNGRGFFFFKFLDPISMVAVLEGGPWHFSGRPIILQKCRPKMKLSRKASRTTPVWARFYDIPLELWIAKGLSYVASAIGKPLYTDATTE
ncbi:hypothetical protein F0562_006025 [Nyssa sinensis]|uniref:DUF4283 domain-containing protein n=1 Tax=Nyssa sinensis TaxID=561372 RepID=A0A5J5ANP2_9ASTE|nr:hypothetical protein F0562_006025 [Nyssa sinensis]